MIDELKPRQRAAAEMMALHPEYSFTRIREELKISEKAFWQWRKNETFMNYYHSLCEKRFKELEAIAIQKLEENIQLNNQKAIEYVLDYQGFAAPQKIEANVSTDITINVEE